MVSFWSGNSAEAEQQEAEENDSVEDEPAAWSFKQLVEGAQELEQALLDMRGSAVHISKAICCL